MFRKVLIANRGEIATRIARTCRELGLSTVAVYSTGDREGALLQLTDEAVHIGPDAPQRSYLSIPNVIEAARLVGADAIHPGYGFLSEDPDFAEICEANGLTLIGPTTSAMRMLSDKASTRKIMRDVPLPLSEGSDDACINESEARDIADRAGYPVLVKAAAGGGGRGMEAVFCAADFSATFRRVRATAQTIFGDKRVYVEKLVPSARHIEVQIVGDTHGNFVHLGSRGCSVQRRHQKLLEEAPAPGLTNATREELCAASIRGAKAVGLTGAATFEFLVDPAERIYFIEVNPRLQVEHGVTEMVTGVDLVEQQIRVAAGEKLTFDQSAIESKGASVECRINAEDPDRDFLPTPGVLTECSMPGGPFTRVDTHAYPSARIPPDYDPLIAKVLTWGVDRATAVSRMQRALFEVRIRGEGVRTTRDTLLDLLEWPEFIKGQYTTEILSERTLS